MRVLLCWILLVAAVGAQGRGGRLAMRDVEIVDARGVVTRASAFRRVSGDDVFRGYRGMGRIEVPYDRLRELRISPPVSVGGRKRIRLVPHEGDAIDAEFDEQENDVLFSGRAHFGRISIFFGDIRRLTVLGKTDPKSLPKEADDYHGLDAKVRDRRNVVTELSGFRRLAGSDHIRGLRGAMTISVRMSGLKRLVIAQNEHTGLMACTATLQSGRLVAFQLPTYEERTVFGGESEFGRYRIQLADIREVIVLRASPNPQRGKGGGKGKEPEKPPSHEPAPPGGTGSEGQPER